MSRVIAAITSDATADAVLSTARAVAKLFGARVEARHVGGELLPLSAAARTAGVDLENRPGESVVAILADAAAGEDVVALVIGARGERAGARRTGAIALGVITLQERPVVVVPPEAPLGQGIERVLVALDGTAASAAALGRIIELAADAQPRIVVAHVHSPRALPAFSDHLSHEVQAWSEEFIARNCPGAAEARLELRVGAPDEHVLDIVRDSGCDLVALGWHQDLSPGRAAVVRRILAESPVPVLLTPVSADGASGAGARARAGDAEAAAGSDSFASER